MYTVKSLRFAEPLPNLILSGQKDTTWRINDDKNISPEDQLSLCYTNRQEFAKVEVIRVKETTFKNLSHEDKEGHEQFGSNKEIFETYTKY